MSGWPRWGLDPPSQQRGLNPAYSMARNTTRRPLKISRQGEAGKKSNQQLNCHRPRPVTAKRCRRGASSLHTWAPTPMSRALNFVACNDPCNARMTPATYATANHRVSTRPDTGQPCPAPLQTHLEMECARIGAFKQRPRAQSHSLHV